MHYDYKIRKQYPTKKVTLCECFNIPGETWREEVEEEIVPAAIKVVNLSNRTVTIDWRTEAAQVVENEQDAVCALALEDIRNNRLSFMRTLYPPKPSLESHNV
ncbi:hypothetical protein PHMEG_00019436 [Phytophthora megakarya]|uniref:Uncharacterized protein n=1 Tax=Phytophthora megakarya TaxID=4795 RepID=A0A225VRX9_9STRA|nr:hypothetical protein PHMEG_00019436 [Phytophthora megakarya]